MFYMHLVVYLKSNISLTSDCQNFQFLRYILHNNEKHIMLFASFVSKGFAGFLKSHVK